MSLDKLRDTYYNAKNHWGIMKEKERCAHQATDGAATSMRDAWKTFQAEQLQIIEDAPPEAKS